MASQGLYAKHIIPTSPQYMTSMCMKINANQARQCYLCRKASGSPQDPDDRSKQRYTTAAQLFFDAAAAAAATATATATAPTTAPTTVTTTVTTTATTIPTGTVDSAPLYARSVSSLDLGLLGWFHDAE
ncbi:hypothetical protein COCSADRAFT_347836 [Bipolaris sorokiniana ND90Pr]|uniref:Uncharacterized protein n=1 Tax=Cochliobolus sativus (strain ND90Pr / ATCC 201652) TaxID=665912 RepID=M2QW13_COCSN|nr:uncharacterized protein COCSADRAFT_347836 [Bipolaris sorokiniana ND90Pr]EMD59289.1 hypothetical protein COCSADRAFT_347836 [Bipolaris sorokiniana ND90Pr]